MTAAPVRRYYILAILTLVFTVQMIDKILPGILLPYIKADLGLSDTQLGLLMGPAFAVVFTLFGLPMAALADRSSRRNIVGIAVLAWSLMTSATGMVSGYGGMLALRLGVGLGEAGCGPASQSIIAEHFPPAERATAMGIYYWGTSFGALLAFGVGGAIAQHFGWRHAFLLAGLPGIVLCILMFTTIPNSRPVPTSQPRASMKAALRYMGRRPTFIYLLIAAGTCNIAYAGGLQWMSSFLSRSYGLTGGQIGWRLALISGVVGTIGLYLGGWLADRLARRDPRWYMWVPVIGMCIAMPAIPLALVVHNLGLALAMFGVAWFGAAISVAPNYAVAQSLASGTMRATAAAMQQLVVTLMGAGVGPQLIGLLSDAFRPAYGTDSLRIALVVVMVPFTIISAAAFMAGSRSLKADFRRVHDDNARGDLFPVSA